MSAYTPFADAGWSKLPEDHGAARHLQDAPVAHVGLRSTAGGTALPEAWEAIPQ